MESNCLYCIERVFRGTEPVFEMAMCEDCRAKIESELSEDSMMRVRAYVEERFDLEFRYKATQHWPEQEIGRWLDRCIFSKTPSSECRDYQLAALCRGDQLSIDIFPIMVSSTVSEEMQKLMSKKTRDRLGDMVEEFFGMPSEFADGPSAPLIF